MPDIQTIQLLELLKKLDESITRLSQEVHRLASKIDPSR